MSDNEPLANENVAVEHSDVSLRLLAYIAVGLAIFAVVSTVAIGLIYPTALYGQSDAPTRQTAEPRLQTDPTVDFAAYQVDEEHQLATYGWVDRQRGIVRIPIDRATQDVAKAGIKDWPGSAK